MARKGTLRRSREEDRRDLVVVTLEALLAKLCAAASDAVAAGGILGIIAVSCMPAIVN